ncbi:glycogen synthase [Deltaproteobacteria bacterium Smac51]|nr:glycogen synthase [Deltaproteobacteria bacterium Smac51]
MSQGGLSFILARLDDEIAGFYYGEAVMQIIFITPEAIPFSRVGGLGDVSFYLPRALARHGHKVTVVVPKHRGSDKMPLTEIPEWRCEIDLSLSRREASFYRGQTGEAHDAILIGCDDLFNRPGLYGNEFGDYDDNAERFIFFSRAALLAAGKLAAPGEEVIIHCHDWASGLVPMCLKSWRGAFPTLKKAGSIFTYHNLASQGLFLHYDFAMTGLDWSLFTHEGMEFHGRMNLTKAGLLAADLITTVSRKYAQESLTPAIGMGLEGVLLSRSDDIVAVQNGVDYGQWDPASDRHIAANYSENNLEGKQECRRHLATLFGFKDPSLPTVAMVCRLLSRKGLDIIVKALDRMMDMPINLAFMGLGENHYQEFLQEAAIRWPGRLGYKRANDLVMIHHILAGADIFMMPSRFEPCGLEQLYALRYGTVPVVRSTGGLDDTVIDVQTNPDEGTGYKFNDYSPEAFLEVLKSAVADFGRPELWRGVMRRAMEQNFSWDISASRYEDVYRRALDIAEKRN